MRIISKKALRKFWQDHPVAQPPLEDWYRIVRNANWQNLAEVRELYPHADLAGNCTIFNIGGNKFRLIVKFKYRWKVVYIRFVLTHAEYDKGDYEDDCYDD